MNIGKSFHRNRPRGILTHYNQKPCVIISTSAGQRPSVILRPTAAPIVAEPALSEASRRCHVGTSDGMNRLIPEVLTLANDKLICENFLYYICHWNQNKSKVLTLSNRKPNSAIITTSTPSPPLARAYHAPGGGPGN
ncbi:Protein of unknown function [Gryllus bimaculatus]|nr:Protein of unknown function [Gryllus bimaculatus]